jgi:hypothetical protein
MARRAGHELAVDRPAFVEHRARAFLAIVDLDSFPPLADTGADHLDVLTHICREAQALHAVMWETPADTLRLQLVLTDRGEISNTLTRTHRLVFDGRVRTEGGRLCLTDDESLLAAARRGDGHPLRGRSRDLTRRPRLLHVPPGVINVGVFCERPGFGAIPELTRARCDYTLVLRHYPPPPPRVAPVRISGGLIPWAGEEAAREPWGERR